MRHPSLLRPFVGVSLTLTTLAIAACVDAPSAPDGSGSPQEPLVIAPVFALVGPDGSTAIPGPQASALSEAFDQVDRFRMRVTRVPSGTLALDTIIVVTPGQAQYDLSVNVDIQGGSEQFSVTLTALKGDVELFTADPITVTAAPTTAGSSSPPPAAADVTLRYSGPGSTATSIVLTPAQAVLAPGGTVQLGAQVLDQGGQPIANVPLAWLSASPAVAAVSGAGLTTAAGNGKTQVTVATPAGLEAKAWVYVLTGELAYVEGGDLKVRAPAGGTAAVRASGGASSPAWTANGQKLYYSAGGQVRLAGGGAVGSGAWPAPSPDGTKIAVDGVGFMNDDGTNPTPGPSGSTPLWLDGETLLVGGGSIQSVRADGSGRSTVVAGDASFPALSGGTLAYISGGNLRVQGRDTPLVTGAGGRPTWSADGAWLVVTTGSGLTLVPSDGGAPPVALPGLGSASQPAFRPAGTLATPLTPVVTGFGPTAPRPGEVVTLVGSGFDWIIPANTRVFWPVPGGTVEGQIQKVTATQIEVLMPANVVAGQVRVTTRSGTGLLAYTPSVATLQVTARTPWDAPVAGMVVAVKNGAGTTLGQAATDATGAAVITGIDPGQVTVTITAPAGFTLDGEADRTLTLPSGPTTLALQATPQVKSVKIVPELLTLEVDGETNVTVTPLDAAGNEIPQVGTVSWGSSEHFVASGTGLSATLFGKIPTPAKDGGTLSVAVDGQTFTFPVSVTSYIQGTVDRDPLPVGAPAAAAAVTDEPAASEPTTEPAPGITVNVKSGGNAVATATTNTAGNYSVTGLFAGTYEVVAVPKGDYSSVPISRTVILGAASPTGKADFHMSLGVADSVKAAVSNATLEALGATTTVTFEAYDTLRVLLGARPATYASTDPSVLTVNGTGKVTAVNNGSAWVRVTVDGVKDSVLVTVDQKAVSLQLFEDPGVPAPDSVRILVQDTGTVFHEAKDANGNLIPPSHRKPTYTPNTGLVDIDVDGHATASASLVGRQVVVANMDAGSDTLIVWVLGVRPGDLTLPGDLATLADSLYGQIQGTVWVDATALGNLDALSTIWEVWGDVNIRDNPSLTDISGLRNIENIGGTLRIKRNDVLATPGGLPAAELKHVGGNLKVWYNPEITNADVFGNLVEVKGYIDIIGNPKLTDVSGFSSLTMAAGLSLVSNEMLSVASGFPALEWIGWDGLYIDEGATVARFPQLKGIEGSLTAGGSVEPINPVESLDFPSLQCVEFDVWIYDNEALTQALFPAMTHVGDCDTPYDYVGAPPAFTSPRWGGATAPQRVRTVRADPDEHHPMSLESRTARLSARFEAQRAERLDKRAGAAAERDAAREQARKEQAARRAAPTHPRAELGRPPAESPRVRPRRAEEPLKSYSESSGIFFEYNPSLGTLNLSALQEVTGDVFLEDNDLGSYTIPMLHTITGDLGIMYSGLQMLSLPNLLSVGSDVYIEYTDEFTTLYAPLLQSVGDDFYVLYNDALGDFELESLKTIGYTIEFYDNIWNSTLRLPALESVYSDVYIQYNTGLTSVDIATNSLLSVGYYFDVSHNDGLETINVPRASYLYYLYVDNNPDLLSVDVATATTLVVDYDFDIHYNTLLQKINVPGLQSAYYLYIDNNPALMTVDLATTASLAVEWRLSVYNNAVPHPWTLNIPGLVSTGSDVEIYANDGLQSATLATGGPATVGGWFEVYGNPDLTMLSAPKVTQVGSTMYLYGNPLMTALTLGSLTTVGNELILHQLGLANLNAFATLQSALVGLYIVANPALTDITGLNGIGDAAGADPVISGVFDVELNPNLCLEDVTALLTLLEAKYPLESPAVSGAITNINNKPCG